MRTCDTISILAPFFNPQVNMKKSTFVIGLLANLLAFGNALAGTRDITPEHNQCAPFMDSKVYLTTDFHAYPREVAFECNYKCNVNGKIDIIKGTSRVMIHNMDDDAFRTTCQGVVLKKVPWGYDFDKLKAFYAPETDIVELKRWSFQNINFNPQNNILERERLTLLKKDLYTIASSFIMAGMNGGSATAHFKEAGLKISEIADGLPMDTKLLDETIEQIVVNKGPRAAAGSSESLIFQMITSSAAWRIPSYLYKN